MVQVVAILLLPVISRYYMPDVLGVLGLFLSIAGFLSIASGGRYEQAVVVARTHQQRNTLIWLTLVVNFFFALLLFLSLPLVRYFLRGEYSVITPYLLWLPFVVLITGAYTSLSAGAISGGRFGLLTISKSIQGIGNNLLKVLIAIVIGASVYGLLGALLFSYSLSLIILCSNLHWGSFPSFEALRREAAYHSKFPRYGIVQAGINNLLGSLLILMLPYEYGMQDIGLLTMAFTLSVRPLQLISDSISEVYFHRASERVREAKPLKQLMLKFLRRWFLIAVPGAIALFFLLPYLTDWILHTSYDGVDLMIRLMLPYLLFNVPASVFNVFPDILEHQRVHMWIQVGFLVIDVLALLLFFFLNFSLVQTLLAYYLLSAFTQFLYIIWLFSLTQKYDRTLPSL